MRIYQNCLEAIKEIERDLFELGTEVHPETMQDIVTKDNDEYKTKELMGYAYSIIDGSDRDDMLDYLKLPRAYAYLEGADRTNSLAYPLNPGTSYVSRIEVWSKFLHDGIFSYTYNERLHCMNQLEKIISELKVHPNTRQGIVQIWDYAEDLGRIGGKERVPCSLMYQFIIREKELHIHYFQRSCDFLTHMGYDIWLAIAIKDYVAKRLGVTPGRLHHYVTSLHAYHKDLKERGIF